MKKIILLSLAIILFTFRVNAEEITINAKSAILIEANTGKVLFKVNENEKLPIASMTKIMSLLLVMEQIDSKALSYDDEVEISAASSSMGGSQVYLNEGEKYTVGELLKSVAMASANDAIVALAEKTHGSVENFVAKMNEKAQKLGCKNTNFVNVHGLDEENHYSSARDMAIIARELLKHEDILKYTSVYEDYLKKKDGSQLWLVNTNKLVRFYKDIDGLKTGYTANAGYCLTATIHRENTRLISVLIGEASSKIRNEDTVRLLNYGLNAYKTVLLRKKDASVGKAKINKGKKDNIKVYLEKDAQLFLKKDEKVDKYKLKINLKELTAPVKRGSIVGKAYIIDSNNKKVANVNLVTKESVNKATIIDYFKRNLKISACGKKLN